MTSIDLNWPLLASMGLWFILERYLLVCKNRRSLERYHVAWIITPVILFSLAYNLPRFFELQVYQDEYSNSTHVIPTAMRMHHLYVHIYIVWINLFVMGIIPYALLITLNIWIFQKLWTMKHERRNENEVRLSLFYAKLCFFVVAVFVLSHSIRWIPNICELYLVSYLHTVAKVSYLFTFYVFQ